jgi:hypothetical protein
MKRPFGRAFLSVETEVPLGSLDDQAGGHAGCPVLVAML